MFQFNIIIITVIITPLSSFLNLSSRNESEREREISLFQEWEQKEMF